MIDLTIKTLDSQNRPFTVPDDYTVRQLKEHIAESVNISADVQRLIHCGRVLNDEKKLTEYNVHGKVIHLVERAPPSTTRGDPDGGTSSSTSQGQPPSSSWRFLDRVFVSGRPRRQRIGQDGNTMYLGAMAFPADLMDARGISMPQPRQGLSQSRLVVARNMLRQAGHLLTSLENRTNASSAAAGSDESSQESEETRAQRDNGSDDNIQMDDNDDANVDIATQAATAAAIVSAVSAAMGDEPPPLEDAEESYEEAFDPEEIANGATTQADVIDITIGGVNLRDVIAAELEMEGAELVALANLNPASRRINMETEPIDDPSRSADGATSAETCATRGAAENNASGGGGAATPPPPPPPPQFTANNENSQSNQAAGSRRSGGRNEGTRTTSMATIISGLNTINRRLEPFMVQYYELLENDPNFATLAAQQAEGAPPVNYPSTAEEADNLFTKISEIMHYLSHAYHALSDIHCSFARQGPNRFLRCRPVLIQHSAVVHAGVPVIVPRPMTTFPSRRPWGPPQSAADPPPSPPPTNTTTTSTEVPSTSNNTPATSDSVADPSAAPSTTTTTTGSSTTNSSGGSTTTPPVPPTLPAAATATPPVPPPMPPPATTTSASVTAGSMDQGPVTFSFTRDSGGLRFNIPLPTSMTNDSPLRISTSSNAEILMAVNGASVTIDSSDVSGGAPPSSASTGGNASQGSGVFPWRNLPPGFFQTLAQALSLEMTGDPNVHLPFSLPQTIYTSPSAAAAGGGTGTPRASTEPTQNSQARGNTQTHPTTATQTRSTSRPQIHLAQTIQNHLQTFDPFLPCNSHHIRNRRSRASAHTTSTTTTSSMSDNPCASRASGTSGGTGGASASSSNNNNNNITTSSTVPLRGTVGVSNITSSAIASELSDGGAAAAASSAATVNGSPSSATLSATINPTGGQLPSDHVSLNHVLISRLADELGFTNGVISNRPLYTLDGNGGNITSIRPSVLRLFPNSPGGAISGENQISGAPLGSPNRRATDMALDPAVDMTFADFLNVPEDTRGRSTNIVEEFLISLARSLVVRNVLEPSSSLDSSNFHHLVEFSRQRFTSNVARTITRADVKAQLRLIDEHCKAYLSAGTPLLSTSVDTPGDIDVSASISQLNEHLLPPVLIHISENQPALFLESFKLYFKTLISLLSKCFNCCILPLTYLAKTIMTHFAGMNNIVKTRIEDLVQMFANFLGAHRNRRIDLVRYIVYRIPYEVTPTARAAIAPQAPAAHVELMDVETESENAAAAPPPLNIPIDDDPLPDNIIIGSESWHNTIPTEWVPIITRDGQRQRRETAQPPFSDAYLAGMPTKRRKIVTNSKPSSNLSQVIADTMTTALGEAGVSTSSDAIAQSAAADPQLRVAFREQVRSQVRDRLQSNADYSSERYPNATKFFEKKRQ